MKKLKEEREAPTHIIFPFKEAIPQLPWSL
jgi:hypothetical protein